VPSLPPPSLTLRGCEGNFPSVDAFLANLLFFSFPYALWVSAFSLHHPSARLRPGGNHSLHAHLAGRLFDMGACWPFGPAHPRFWRMIPSRADRGPPLLSFPPRCLSAGRCTHLAFSLSSGPGYCDYLHGRQGLKVWLRFSPPPRTGEHFPFSLGQWARLPFKCAVWRLYRRSCRRFSPFLAFGSGFFFFFFFVLAVGKGCVGTAPPETAYGAMPSLILLTPLVWIFLPCNF